MSDFIWAIRVAKISKGVFDSKWSVKTFSKGATFGTEQTLHSVENVLSEEGIKAAEKIVASDGGIFAILDRLPEM